MTKLNFAFFALLTILFCAACNSYEPLINSGISSLAESDTLDNELPEFEEEINSDIVSSDISEEISDETESYTEPQNPAEQLLSNMTIEEKVGQMFMLAFRKDSNGNIYEITDSISDTIKEINPGGIILFSENISTGQQVKELIDSFQRESKHKLFIGVDEEGGSVSRLKNILDPMPSAKTLAEKYDTEEVYEIADVLAKELRELGFNVNFAPVCDINTNPRNPVIGNRAYGSEAQTVIEYSIKIVEAMQDNRIGAVAKHFPGHGDTVADSHKGMASVEFDMERLEASELLPFKAAAEAEVFGIMVGFISTPNITGNYEPAVFSEYLVGEVLRKDIGFNGIIFTDAMDMGAITKYYSSSEAAVKAIEAGIDVLLMPDNIYEAYSAVVDGVKTGVIKEERIDESVIRILEYKEKM